MNLEWTAEQKILRDSVARFCRTETPIEVALARAEGRGDSGEELWRKIAEQGWLGVLVPEEYGGLGLGVTDLGIILEEMGRALVPGPYFSTAALGTPSLVMGASAAIKLGCLEAIVAGEKKITLALLEEDGQLGPSHVKLQARKKENGYLLNGKKFFVPDIQTADLVIVAGRTAEGDDGTTLFLIDTHAPGVSIEENQLWDSTSRSGQLVLKNVEIDTILGEPEKAWNLVDPVLLIANAGIAAGSVAAAEQVLQQVLDFARKRMQFGVPIGSFQAVKHPLANLFAEIESARSAYHYAAWAVDARSQDARAAAGVARLTCTEAYRHATLVSLQAHGGIGFTWEYDLHLHVKRAMHNMNFLGVPSDYERVVAAEALGL
jgi:alkylation response protein AidB-like acyl-CoA dehydrogenase